MRVIIFVLSAALGYLIGTFAIDSGSSRYYVFKLYPIGSNPATTLPVKGFACKCDRSAGTSALSWQGWPDNGCDNTQIPPDQPLTLGDPRLGTNKMSNPPPVPTGACCKPRPRINGIIMPGVPSGSC